ncbi:LuxR C-terminal-related transcriptional regulator [Micromonospora sp. CPCC 206171]|uniref:ATP-binding protein n=1 Tax=Micromonospora sp. CPCC 206171 TaxID=3122405 RepID=UPI002FF35D87
MSRGGEVRLDLPARDGTAQEQSEVELIGRIGEAVLLDDFLASSAAGGAALLVSGEAGAGKTALLDLAAPRAAVRGFRVLRAAGVEFESEMSYTGLLRVLTPLLAGLDRLGPPQEQALSVALGLTEGQPPSQLAVANATLSLLRDSTVGQPLLLIVDDLPWIDAVSATVLAFVARRLAGSRVGFLAAFRTGEGGCFEGAGLDELEVKPLDDDAAACLLTMRFPALSRPARQLVLDQAEGNPLALLELPRVLSRPQAAEVAPGFAVLPLSQRLEGMFATRVSQLPDNTRKVLLLAALEGTGDIGLLEAASAQAGGLSSLSHAERAELVHVDMSRSRLDFRHPLVRSAVVQMAGPGQQRSAHAALAEQLHDQPYRRAMHLAGATEGKDESVAGLVERAAVEMQRRGDPVGAVTALRRAAELSPHGGDESQRLAQAAYLRADVTGDLRGVPELLNDARRADAASTQSLASAVALSSHRLHIDGDVDSAHRTVVEAINALPDRDAPDQTLIEALYYLVAISSFGARDELWRPVHAAIDRLGPRVPEFLALLATTYADPVRLARPMLGRLDTAVARLTSDTDPGHIVRVAIAAGYVDRLPACREALSRVVEHGRTGGAITAAIQSLLLLGNDAFSAGEWDKAWQLCGEGLELCESHGYRLLGWPIMHQRAMIAAARGDTDEALAVADHLDTGATPRRVGLVTAYASGIRALAALGRGQPDEAFRHANAVSPAGTLASHLPYAMWAILDLVDAATLAGRHREAAAHAAAAEGARLREISPRLALIAIGSSAIAAPDDRKRDLFEEALAVPGADRHPFEFARITLHHGEYLRRSKAVEEAREPLAAARRIFQRLRAEPWSRRAGREIRAAGGSAGTQPAERVELTEQQREIAQLAATGLTNKQIGERLFLSSRTVGTHLYQIFPKLGVTSRAELRDALAKLPSDDRDN